MTPPEQRRDPASGAERQAQRDLKVTSEATFLLAILGAIGIAGGIYASFRHPSLAIGGQDRQRLYLIMGSVVGVSMAYALLSKPGQSGGEVVLRGLSCVGIVVAAAGTLIIGLLLLVSILCH